MSRIVRFAAAAVLAVALAAPAAALDNYTYTLAGFFGIGGPSDVDPDPGYDNEGAQLLASMVIQPRTLVGVRVGGLKFEGEGLGRFAEADLEWITVAGEYRFRQSFYDFGAYLGLGNYTLDGRLFGGAAEDDSGIGLSVGLTGDFDLTQHLSLVAEFSGHYTWLDDVELFGVAHAGLAIHF